MVLREKLKSIKMVKDEGMATYLTRITQVRDELAVVGGKGGGWRISSTSPKWSG